MKRRRPRKKNCGRYGHGARSIRRHAMTRTPPAMGNSPIPQHVAIIMDGNGRWAQARGKLRPAGHREGVKAVRKIVSAARNLGIEVLTRSEEHTSELQSLMRISYAVFCLKKKKQTLTIQLSILVSNNKTLLYKFSNNIII